MFTALNSLSSIVKFIIKILEYLPNLGLLYMNLVTVGEATPILSIVKPKPLILI